LLFFDQIANVSHVPSSCSAKHHEVTRRHNQLAISERIDNWLKIIECLRIVFFCIARSASLLHRTNLWFAFHNCEWLLALSSQWYSLHYQWKTTV